MARIVTCLAFNSEAEQAVQFYTSLFRKSRIVATTRAGQNGPAPAGTLITATFELDGQEFLALNGGPSFTFSQGFSIVVRCETQAEIDELWDSLSAGGRPGPCGWVTDRFGVSWQIIPADLAELMGSSDAKKAQNVMAALMQMSKIDAAQLRAAFDQA
jgi:predicted 3-demethylubiquinone-9 3-methyltransferase (glyoxalase superfamily)